MDSNLIFVYGSMRIGFNKHSLLEKSEYLGPGITRPVFELVDLGSFPGMIEKGGTAVRGEVYAVDDKTLARIDGFEGHPDFYVRKQIELQNGMLVWTYLWPNKSKSEPIIPSGDWAKRSNL